jgi:BASS family bile acid:Na+ symporter
MNNQYFPLVVVAVMLALGLTLTIDDFRRAATMRRPLAVALICQSVLLPGLCLLIAQALHLAPNMAVGLMLMAATPGGTTSSILSHLFNGDLALNLTLTAINAVISIFALPAILALSRYGTVSPRWPSDFTRRSEYSRQSCLWPSSAGRSPEAVRSYGTTLAC